MATYEHGPLGEFSGKLGPIVGSSWKGKGYIRSAPSESNKSRTAKQLAQQDKFGLVGKFTAALGKLLNLGFKDYAVDKTGANYAMSLIMRNLVIGEHPNLQIKF